jgi:chromosome segregation ATPase
MPSFGDIWRSGFGRIGCGRRCRELSVAIEKLQRERPTLLIGLAQAAWRADAISPDFSPSAAELLAEAKELEQAFAAKDEGLHKVGRAREVLAEAEREHRLRIEEASKPLRVEQAEYDRLRRRLNQLEHEKTRLGRAIPLLKESADKISAKIAEIEASGQGDGSLARLRSDLERRRRDARESGERFKSLADEKLPALRPEVEQSAKALAALRDRVDELKNEANRNIAELRQALAKALETNDRREREARTLEESIRPLLYQLGEELNGRRVMHQSLSEHYHRLDEQIARLKGLYASLGSVKADMDKLNPLAIRIFWSIVIGSGTLIVAAAVLMSYLLLR